MRKVFVSILTNNSTPAQFQSRDLDLCGLSFKNPVSYLAADAVSAWDTVIVVTGLFGDNLASRYESLKTEICGVCLLLGVVPKFIPIYIDSNEPLDSLSCSEFFKSVSDVIKDGDLLYADITSDVVPLSFSILIALNYASKACSNVRVSSAICCQKEYIIDITALIHLLSITSAATAKKKKELDLFLGLLIGA